MTLLRCPKFLRCLTADAGNFDRGHSLTSLPLPPAALGSLPTTSVRTGLGMTGCKECGKRDDVGIGPYGTVRRGGVLPRPRATARVAPTEGYKRCGAGPGGSSRRPTPTHHSPIGLRRGRRPRRPCSLIYIGSPHPFSPHFLFNVCGFSVENAPVPYFSPFPVEIAHFPCGQKI